MNDLSADDTSIDILLPTSCCDQIRRLVRYWQRIRPVGGLPSRRDVDPTAIPDLLPHLWMLDVFRDPWRFRFRLVGTAIVAHAGRDSTGRWCDEVYPDFAATDAFRYMRDCAEIGRPLFRTAPLLGNRDRVYRQAQRIYLLLANDGVTTDIILSMTHYLPD